MRITETALALALAALALGAAPALAQEAPEAHQAQDARAPTLEVPSDPEIPHWSLAVSTDPLGMFFGEFGVRFEGTMGPLQSIAVEPAYLRTDGVDALGVEVAYHLWPFAEGLLGLYLGPVLGVAVTTDRLLTGTASLEAGFQYVWDGIVLGAGGGATWSRPLSQSSAWTLSPRAQVTLGWAWM